MTTQVRHKQLTPLEQPRELILACPSFRSTVNLSRIVRLASCAAAKKIIAATPAKVDPKIARDGAEELEIERRRSLGPVLKTIRQDGFQLVGLEQTNDSESLFDFQFDRKTVLVIGHERHGIAESLLPMMDRTVEIPVYGLPFSYNVVTATTMAVYEYCKQFPVG